MPTSNTIEGRRPVWAAVVIALATGLAGIAAMSIMAMITVVCVDVVMRLPFINRPLVGVYDLVQIFSAIALAAALPYTTAIKGHVAVEFFFHKLGKVSRVVVDSAMRLLSIVMFGFLTFGCARYGLQLLANHQVSQTLRLPIFWLPIFISFCCLIVTLVIVHHLVYPKREMIKP